LVDRRLRHATGSYRQLIRRVERLSS